MMMNYRQLTNTVNSNDAVGAFVNANPAIKVENPYNPYDYGFGKFDTLVEPSTKPSADVKMSVNVIPSERRNDQPVNYYTQPVNQNNYVQANAEFTGLVEPMPDYGPAMDLNMNMLITNEVKPVPVEANSNFNDLVTPAPVYTPPVEVNASFDSLITPSERVVKKQFGVAPIPDGTDRSMLPKPVSIADSLHINKSQEQQTPGKKVNNWFSRLIDQRGEDYISSGKLTIDEVSKNAERILDDMISGKIDYSYYGRFIIKPVIIETLINYCTNKLAINSAIQYSLGYIYNDYMHRMEIADPARQAELMKIDDSLFHNITQSIAIVNQDICIYNILYNKLTYTNATKNASNLFSLTNELNNYRKQMRKRY